MLYPNGQRAINPLLRQVSGALPAAGVMRTIKAGECLNRTANFVKTASIPEGYAPNATVVMPVKAGGMSGTAHIAVSGEGNLLQGGPMVGEGSMSFTSDDASLGLIVSMSGAGTITFTAAGTSLALTMAMDGNGNITLTGSGGLSMIVPFEGNGNITFTGSADLRGRCSMQGEWTPYTELSPENLARAVWDALATQFNETGTMGSKLNTASSGGVDMGAMVDAVLAALNATTGARTLGQHLQIQTAVLAGETSGSGTTHITFSDGTVSVEADVPAAGQTGYRKNVVIAGV